MAEPKYYDELPTYIMHSDGEFADGKFRAVDGSGNSLDISLPVDSEHNAESIVIETSDTKGTISVGYSETDNQASLTVTGDLNIVIGDKKFRLYLAKVTIAGNTIDSVELSVEDGENNVIALSVPSTTFIMNAITNLINQRVPKNIKDGTGTGGVISGDVSGADACVASGENSFAGGVESVASGAVSFAFGSGAESTETRAVSFHIGKASGLCSFAIGYGQASGEESFAGADGMASGYGSFAFGPGCSSEAEGAVAFGTRTVAQGYLQTVIGTDNIPQGGSDYMQPTDNAFIIGNGTRQTKSNAFAVRWDGAIVLANGTVLTVEQLAKVANLT